MEYYPFYPSSSKIVYSFSRIGFQILLDTLFLVLFCKLNLLEYNKFLFGGKSLARLQPTQYNLPGIKLEH